MKPDPQVIQRFHRTLVEEINRDAPGQLERPFTVAEIYQSLVPYRTHRDRIGVEMNGDYEDALLRLLAGEGGFLMLGSDSARERIRKELSGSNPNTGLYREFAAVEVRLNPDKLPPKTDRSRSPGRDVAAADDRTAAEPEGGKTGSSPDTRASAREAAPSASPATGEPATRAAPGPSGSPGTAASSPSSAGGSASSARSTSGVPAGAAPGPAVPRDGARSLSDACPECERPLPARQNLRFCPHCGANPHQVECSACGELLEREWSYCIACGTPAES